MRVLEIVATVIFVVVVASAIGLFVQRFRVRTWQLYLMMAIGFGLLVIGSQSGIVIVFFAAIVLLGLGSGGVFYMEFMGGKERQRKE